MSEKRQIVYFHGLPGTAEELQLFIEAEHFENMDIFVPGRRNTKDRQATDTYFQSLARQVDKHFPAGKIEIIGFSLGTFAALQTVPHIERHIDRIDLIAIAAPLHWGAYLDAMAGKAVFSTAQKSAMGFRTMVAVQGLFSRLMPDWMFAQIFNSATGKDADLAQTEDFRAVIADMISQSLNQNRSAYMAEIMRYVRDWQLADVVRSIPVKLWHGEADNWTPLAMAHDMQSYLGAYAELETFAGLSHYSTLQTALPQILTGAKASVDLERSSTKP
ncbi:MAG: alpha/beta hydrolase [Pseudomonadota bacterium]